MEISVTYSYRADEIKPLSIEDLATFVLTSENLPFNTEASISFVTNEVIAELNERYRDKEGPTDVLSFPCDSPTEDLSASLLSQAPVLELGDIVVAPDMADENCKAYDTTFADEIALLVVHGLLHLCDYDHVSDEEAQTMEAREKTLLSQWESQRS